MCFQSLVVLATTNFKQTLKACIIVAFLGLSNGSSAMDSAKPTVNMKRDVVIAPDANGILYVKQANTTSGTGSSWNDALTEFADALIAASEINTVTTGKVKEIWIAGGTHRPLYQAGNSTHEKSRSFVLVKDVKIYGGFAGTETTLATRDLSLTAHATILTGDMNADDGPNFSNYSDNIHHVMIASGDLGSALVDGLTIQGGNANNSPSGSFTVNGNSISNANGGGFYCRGSSIQLNHVRIYRNNANVGGAIYNQGNNPGSTITINNTIIDENRAGNSAVLYNLDFSSANFSNVLIANNIATAATSAAIILNSGRSENQLTFTNVTIVGNKLDNGSGGVIFNLNNSPTTFYLRNCIVLDNTRNNNTTPTQLVGMGVSTGNTSNSLIQGLSATANNNVDATGVTAGDVFKNVAAGNFNLKAGAIVINKGRNDVVGFSTDLAGRPRIFNNTVDLGAYEWHKEILEMSFANVEDDKLVATYGDADFWPLLTPSLEVTLSVPDANGKATIIDNKVHILEAGEVVVTLTFAGDATYEPLTTSKTLLIKKATQTLTFPVLVTKQLNAPDFEPLASTNSGLPLSYTSSNTNVAEVYQDALDNNKWKIKVKGIGFTDITAVQAGNINYTSASLLRTLQVEEGTLPVQLISYQAKLEAAKVKLTWTTQLEQNNKTFIISHATDGKNFKVLTEVHGKGSSSTVNSYQYEHLSPLAGTNYYQLVQVDFNGDRKELGIKTVDFKLGNGISLYPNPVVEKATVVFGAGYQAMELMNGNGKVLQRIGIAPSDTSKEISLANYPSAIYFIKLSGGSKTDVLKVIKQ